MKTRKYAIILAKGMEHPYYIVIKTAEELIQAIGDVIHRHGDIELIYRVY